MRNAEHPTSNIQRRTSNLAGWLRAAFFLAAAGVTGVGLVKSYSRGAWVGAAVGVAYLAFRIGKAEKLKTEKLKGGWSGGKAESREQKAEIGRGKAEMLKTETLKAARRWGAFLIIFASVGVLAFWSFRHTDRAVVRRTYTAANANDFSWRNRVAAWEGALQMMAERPWLGFGWNQPERVYDQYYRATKLNEGMAIQLNDYFILGTTLGVPALLCFAMYVGLSLSPKSKALDRLPEVQSPKSKAQSPEDGRQRAGLPAPPTLDFRLWTLDSAAVCRAAAVVLLVGFWFDGGLFKLATGATFWILLELGRAGDYEIHEAHESE